MWLLTARDDFSSLVLSPSWSKPAPFELSDLILPERQNIILIFDCVDVAKEWEEEDAYYITINDHNLPFTPTNLPFSSTARYLLQPSIIICLHYLLVRL